MAHTKKWLPVLGVLLLAGIGAAILLFTPEPDRNTPRMAAIPPLPEPTAAPPPSTGPSTSGEDIGTGAVDPGADEDEGIVIPPIDLFNDEDEGKPAPFAPPDKDE